MNSAYLDLHGLTEQEAVSAILSALFSLEDGMNEELEIVTGNGYVLTRVVEEILDEEGYDYFHRNGNTGSYIVQKK